MAAWRVGSLVVAWLAIGCGDDGDDPGLRDGSPDDGPPDLVIAAPEPPALPMLTTCPTGWHEVTEGDLTYCAPYDEDGPRSCPPGEAHFPGEPGCTTIGMRCPDDDFPDDATLPADRNVLFVHPDATSAGSTGDRDAPFPTLAQALAVADDES